MSSRSSIASYAFAVFRSIPDASMSVFKAGVPALLAAMA